VRRHTSAAPIASKGGRSAARPDGARNGEPSAVHADVDLDARGVRGLRQLGIRRPLPSIPESGAYRLGDRARVRLPVHAHDELTEPADLGQRADERDLADAGPVGILAQQARHALSPQRFGIGLGREQHRRTRQDQRERDASPAPRARLHRLRQSLSAPPARARATPGTE
jgi:hypothetical protein